MRTIRIAGSGPAGLSAAITLAKAGFSVEVYERNAEVGHRFSGDCQGLENWSEKENVIDDIRKMGIEINFSCEPFNDLTFTNAQDSISAHYDPPAFYLVKRGTAEGSLDQGLKQQAIAAGAKILLNTPIDIKNADIVATGPRL